MKRSAAFTLVFLLLSLSCALRRPDLSGQQAKKVITHKVQEGESWESIAHRYYGDKQRSPDLAVYNGRDITRRPTPGEGIKIPLGERDLRRMENKINAARVYNNALELARKQNYAEAVVKFQESLKIDRSFHDAAYNLGVTYQKLGLHDKAVGVLGSLVLEEQSKPEYFFALGSSYFYSGDYVRAEENFRTALKLDEGHLKSLFSLAIVFEKTGRPDQAIACWDRYILCAPEGEWKEQAHSHRQALETER
ncbi:MAG: tetratricopeptide repeat protein [Candidatus Krumholzibacteriota bacterium]|nr:tetratricopeptide repeat protein [Candidatus Krumholzibacteriota bacterium]